MGLKGSSFPTGEVSDLDWAWLGGFFDGEGCFEAAFSRTRNCGFTLVLAISITNTDKDLMDRCVRIYGNGGIYDGPRLNGKSPKHKMSYRFRITGKPKMIEFIERLYPYLHGKRRRAELFYDLCMKLRSTHTGAGYSNEDWDSIIGIYNEFRSLNVRGTEPYAPVSPDTFRPKKMRTWRVCTTGGCMRQARTYSHGQCKKCRSEHKNLSMISGG